MIKLFAKGIDELLDKVNKIKKDLDDKKFLQEVGYIELEDIRTRIGVSKQTPEGQPWKPWHPSTAAYRMKKGNANQGLLFDSGRLLNSFRVILDNKEVTIGTNVPYAPFLNNGTDRMPARKFMGVSPQAKATIKAILEKKLGLPKI